MNPSMHTPCPVCGAMTVAGMQRCRYCGEALMADPSPMEPAPAPEPPGFGTEDYALLVAVGTLALPVQAAVASLTPPYAVPLEALAVGPHAIAGILLGFLLGLVWLPRSSRFVALVLAFLFNGFTFVQMSSWRAMELPIDPSLLPLGCMVGLVAAVGAWMGCGAAGFSRRTMAASAEATATLGG